MGSELPWSHGLEEWRPEPQAETGILLDHKQRLECRMNIYGQRKVNWQGDQIDALAHLQGTGVWSSIFWLGRGQPCAEWSSCWDTLYEGSMLKSLINILCLTLSEIFWRSVGFPVFLNPRGQQICWWCKSMRETARIKVLNAIKWNWFQ